MKKLIGLLLFATIGSSFAAASGACINAIKSQASQLQCSSSNKLYTCVATITAGACEKRVSVRGGSVSTLASARNSWASDAIDAQ